MAVRKTRKQIFDEAAAQQADDFDLTERAKIRFRADGLTLVSVRLGDDGRIIESEFVRLAKLSSDEEIA